MTIHVQTKTGKSKGVAYALGAILKAAPVYKGFPKHSYMIGDIRAEEGGEVVFPDSASQEAVRRVTEALAGVGFALAEPSANTPEKPDTLAIEMPADGFTDTAVINLEKLVANKATVIKLALGAEALPIERTTDTLRFPWFRYTGDADTATAYAAFICKLCDMAKSQKRVVGRESPAENPKWEMRTFLLRLGLSGEKHKPTRKLLTANLSGDGAYRGGQRPEKKVTQ